MNKKELIKLLDKYEIEYEITDNTTEVEEGLRLLDEALEKIGIIIPKETQVDNITRKNDPEVPKCTIEWASSDDTISRQAAIELACWRCKKCERQDCEHKDSCETMKLLDALPSEDAKPLMLNNDCISRADAIEAVQTYLNILINSRRHGDDFTFINVLTEIRNKISALPPVEPGQSELHIDEPRGYTLKTDKAKAYSERPKGEWVASYFNECCGTDENHNPVFRKTPCVKCDQCGEKRRNEEKFCPNCGADMKGADDETD